MTATFPLNNGRDQAQLLNHLAKYHLIHPANCVVTVQSAMAVVSSLNSFALGTAKTAW